MRKKECWMEYSSELLNSDPPLAQVDNIQPELDQLDIDMKDQNEEEIMKCIKQLKNHKAAGYNDITGGMLKSGGEKLEEWITRIYKIERKKNPKTEGKEQLSKCQKKGPYNLL